MKHVVWTNYDLDYEDFRGQIEEAYPDYNDDQKNAVMYEINDDYLDDERMNLKIDVGEPILVIADLGLWDGRRSGYREIDSGLISDCLYSQGDYSTWYVNDKAEFVCDDIHHDGTNHYTYRVYLPEAGEATRDELKEKLYFGTATQKDIDRVTRKLGPDVANVYGWELSEKTKVEAR